MGAHARVTPFATEGIGLANPVLRCPCNIERLSPTFDRRFAILSRHSDSLHRNDYFQAAVAACAVELAGEFSAEADDQPIAKGGRSPRCSCNLIAIARYPYIFYYQICIGKGADMNSRGTVKRLHRTRSMSSPSSEELIDQNTRLRARVKELECLIAVEKKVSREMERRHRVLPSVLQGRRGELLVADVSRGALMDYASKFDVLTPANAKIEVKVSRAHDKSNEDYSECRGSYGKTFCWIWSNVLGSVNRPKKYDFLVLIGVMPEEEGHDDVPELAYFFVHVSEVKALTTIGSGGRLAIQLGTNFKTVRSVSKPLIDRRVTLSDLEVAIQMGRDTL
jgi:hypothetical protein